MCFEDEGGGGIFKTMKKLFWRFGYPQRADTVWEREGMHYY